MAKVKKTAAVTGVRNVKASKGAGVRGRRSGGKAATVPKAKQATARPAKGVRTAPAKSAGKKAKTKATRASGSKRGSMAKVKSISKARALAGRRAPAPVVRVAVKALEPQAKCGTGTSVQHLLRVDETVDGRTTAHLVFFDRHGWYCVHGPACVAVTDVRKELKERERAARR